MEGIPVPSVGRMVHYISAGSPPADDGRQLYPSCCRTAVITEVDIDELAIVGLAITNPTGMHFRSLEAGGVPYADESGFIPCTWHWPERVGS